MTDTGAYLALTAVLLLAMGWGAPRVGSSTTAPLVTWRTWHGVALWFVAGAVALLGELGGQAAGLWDWQAAWQPVLHAWWWWATLLVVGLLRLRPLGTGRWFLVQLAGTLAFEVPQQALLGWVDHADLLDSPYPTIVAVHVVVAGLVVTLAPGLALRLGLLRRSWGS